MAWLSLRGVKENLLQGKMDDVEMSMSESIS